MPANSDVFVDTAGWACYLDRNEPLHQQVFDVVQLCAMEKRRLVTSNYIIAELVALLSSRQRFPRPQMFVAIDALHASDLIEVVTVDQALDAEAWALLKSRPDKSWSLVDASSFVLKRRRGLTAAITLDHHFLQAGFVRLPLGQS